MAFTSTSLRQRNRHESMSPEASPPEQQPYRRAPPSAIHLHAALQALPQQTGPVQKLSIPALFLCLPLWLQRWIMTSSLLSFLRPVWKTRHLVLLGSYLYRFDPTTGALKGSPLLISTVTAHLLDRDDDETTVPRAVRWAAERQSSYGNILCIRTLTHSHYYVCQQHPDANDSTTDARLWLTSIQDAQHEATKRSMGHVATPEAVPRQWQQWDTLGRSVAQRKERIRRRVAALELSSATMTTDGGGIYARGYYG